MNFKFEIFNLFNEDNIYDKEIEKALVTSQFKGNFNNCGNMGIRKNIIESMERTTREMTIQATKIFLMKLVINGTSLDIRKQIAIINRGMNNQIIMELMITATSLYISKNIAARNKVMNKQISQRTKK